MMEITKRIYFLTWLLACIEIKTDTLYAHTRCTLGRFLSFFRYTVAHPKVFAEKSNKKGNNVQKKRQQIYIPSISFARIHIYHFLFLWFRTLTASFSRSCQMQLLANLIMCEWCVQQIERTKLLLPVLSMPCENEQQTTKFQLYL